MIVDIFKNISSAEDRDIIISIPKNMTWLEYLSCFMELKISGGTFDIIVQTVPRTSAGKRCYLVYDGFIKGWMEIYKMRETADNEICIELTPSLTSMIHKMPVGDIDGYKYFLDNSNMQ